MAWRCAFLVLLVLAAGGPGCTQLVRTTDRDVAEAIAKRQQQALARALAVAPADADPLIPHTPRAAYATKPAAPAPEVPPEFELPAEAPEPRPHDPLDETADAPPAVAVEPAGPQRFRESLFTLTDALGYAQQHQRAYLSAREDLYLSALALTLERHLWTPQFAAEMRTVYGNFGEITNFDQAMRFVADLSAAQRLPFGGEFTAGVVSTLIRDVKKSITAVEGSTAQFAVNVPLLRGAGHVAREDLIQLERDLTYAVREFERFRRRQLVEVARSYFDLLRSKQAVLDGEISLRNAADDLRRVLALSHADQATLLDVGRAEQRMLSERNRLAQIREAFRADVDQFKILIGMPIAERIGLDDLETIESIERQIEAGVYPLLRTPLAAGDVALAVQTAEQHRLDLENLRSQMDDARRGVAVARNALLPDLNFQGSLTYDTDPERFRITAFESARATWRSEVILAMNDRFRERSRFRASLIDVRRAQRFYDEQIERVRAEVYSAVNQIRLQEELVEIQFRNLEVADKQREFAEIQFEEGLIDNRDKVEADDAYVQAQNALNFAKTARWTALLTLRLVTDTLRIDESGAQMDDETP